MKRDAIPGTKLWAAAIGKLTSFVSPRSEGSAP